MGKKDSCYSQKEGGSLGKKEKQEKGLVSGLSGWWCSDGNWKIEYKKKKKTDVADIIELIRHYSILGDEKAAWSPCISVCKRLLKYVNISQPRRIQIQSGGSYLEWKILKQRAEFISSVKARNLKNSKIGEIYSLYPRWRIKDLLLYNGLELYAKLSEWLPHCVAIHMEDRKKTAERSR